MPTPSAPSVTTKPLEPHPLADIFPMLDQNEPTFIALVEDIKANGLQEPITLLDGKILDGRNRYEACKLIAASVKTRDYAGADPIGFVLSANLHRRHLNESQRSIVAAKLSSLELGANQHTKGQGVSIDTASQLLNVGRASVARAKKVLAIGSPELIQAVQQGEVSVSGAAKQVEENQTPSPGDSTPKRSNRNKRTGAVEKVRIEYQKATDTKSALAACDLLKEHLLDALEDLSEFSSLGHAETFAEQIKDDIDNKIEGMQGEEEEVEVETPVAA